MSKCVNKVIVLGHLGSDPELRHTTSGLAVAKLNVALTEKWKGRDGQEKEHTEWVRLEAWGKLAEIIGQYASKGQLIYAEGRLRTDKWQDDNGNQRQYTKVNLETFKILERRHEHAGAGRNTAPADEDIPF